MDVRAEQISKKYFRETGESNYFFPVEELSLALEEGSFTLLQGRSGSGKTTLLSMLAGILAPTSGKVLMGGEDLYAMGERERARFRNRYIGVVPQGQSAVASLTVLENVILPARMYEVAGERERTVQANLMERGNSLLERFGIPHLAGVSPRELSGGELRRMAIARSMICRPKLILADEPTADLDDENTALILETLQEITREGTSLFVVSHERDAERYADHRYRMDGGCLTSVGS